MAFEISWMALRPGRLAGDSPVCAPDLLASVLKLIKEPAYSEYHNFN